MSFFVIPIQNIHIVIFHVNLHRTRKQWALTHKTALECKKNDEFFVMPLKHVLSVMDLVNQSGTPKLWAIGHENGPKTQKR
jgi:hypothetical protein